MPLCGQNHCRRALLQPVWGAPSQCPSPPYPCNKSTGEEQSDLGLFARVSWVGLSSPRRHPVEHWHRPAARQIPEGSPQLVPCPLSFRTPDTICSNNTSGRILLRNGTEVVNEL